jgi:hypothetical protein
VRGASPHLLTALIALLLLPAGARAAVPPTFFGANWEGEIVTNASDATVHDDWRRMSRTGVRTARVPFEWVKVEREPGVYDFTLTDRMVRMGALHDVELLPVVMYAPPWARERRGVFASPPADPRAYAGFLAELVRRYGRTGSFWVDNPQLPWRPIHHWQVWNEPHLPYQWDARAGDDWARDYGRLLRFAARAVRRRDPDAKLVLAGLTNRSFAALDELYRRGRVRGAFDVAALHPYTRRARGVVVLTKRFRAVLRRHRDGRRPVWITELGLPASRGRYDSDSLLQTTDRGMAEFLAQSYRAVARARHRPASRADRVYWFTWASRYCCSQFRFAGLLRYDNRDGLEPTPALTAYADTVTALGGRPRP